jgi:hypothetical protein
MIKYTDDYVTTIVRGLSASGERFISACAGVRQSFWSFRLPFFKHAYLFIATSARLIVIDHRRGLLYDRLDRVESLPWSNLGAVKVAGFLFGKKLIVRDAANRVVLKASLTSVLGPRPNNAASARALVQAWEQRNALSAAPNYGALPAMG